MQGHTGTHWETHWETLGDTQRPTEWAGAWLVYFALVPYMGADGVLQGVEPVINDGLII